MNTYENSLLYVNTILYTKYLFMKYHISFDLELRRNPYKGTYIALEGIDGSGKSTQIAALQAYFEKKGEKITLTFEPRNDIITGEIIRDILSGAVSVPPSALQYLYSANRAVNHEEIVYP